MPQHVCGPSLVGAPTLRSGWGQGSTTFAAAPFRRELAVLLATSDFQDKGSGEEGAAGWAEAREGGGCWGGRLPLGFPCPSHRRGERDVVVPRLQTER